MLVGQKDKDREALAYPRALLGLLNRKRGFTLVEVMVTALLLTVIFTALFLVLNVGELTNAVSQTKLEVQQEVRRAIDWIVRDLRQTDRMRLLVTRASGAQSQFNVLSDGEIFTDPVFQICQGYSGSARTWSANSISYAFDAASQRVIRTDSGTGQAWLFKNINSMIFTKISLNLLRVAIAGQKIARGNIMPTFNLTEEVNLRNE